MASLVLSGFSMFGDEVYTSTDLNRRSGEVLNHARLGPVTISRNNEQFALLRREEAAKLIRIVDRMAAVIDLLSVTNAVIHGETPAGAFSWLAVYEKDDLEKLFQEVSEAARSAITETGDFSRVAGVIHEWRESALVAQSGVLDEAMFHTDADEVELPSPQDILEASSEVACSHV